MIVNTINMLVGLCISALPASFLEKTKVLEVFCKSCNLIIVAVDLVRQRVFLTVVRKKRTRETKNTSYVCKRVLEPARPLSPNQRII